MLHSAAVTMAFMTPAAALVRAAFTAVVIGRRRRRHDSQNDRYEQGVHRVFFLSKFMFLTGISKFYLQRI